MQKKQIAVGVVVLAIMGYLYNLPVKGLIKPKEAKSDKTNVMTGNRKAATAVTVDMVSAPAKAAIGAALAAKINDLEGQLKNASGTGAAKLQQQLAAQWDDVNQPAPAAFYYQALARKDNKAQDWLNAGNRFNDAYKLTQDTLLQPAFVTSAAEAFQSALKLTPESLEGKTGLGIAYVNGAAGPMQGIALLLEVVKKDPNNWNANLNLGMFAMKSGQYEKAVARFKTLLAQKTELEPTFYLAESYKQLGMKKEAIDAYQKCKEMMPDPTFGQKIDEYIKELRN
ncbi:Cytochrome c-type biogenesis protein CcmH/NrfG [Mucilaginibacter pineti]|uniref:Cytochrome c-type biogenesis protein CcmH/NrfG n=1 Tax=Mucilaginibacter pineti TaxID=1391627 RepID=A0A1G7DQP6_9SPHI|nr:tetratricopeptide repeat protein [Mucilaginibacter pineti]SDE53851.1 Cytochrome c-type biogenesis protein CcmH/NrfG [Mucilaginibacter pineti]